MLKGRISGSCELSKDRHSGSGQDRGINDSVFNSDEFRMFSFKIKRCPRNRSHNWTECPFAHRGEKAQRRDPCRFNYAAVPCPMFRNGKCPKGVHCEFTHGVFEYWLHPSRYRTRACNAGLYCRRKVCFFAHTPAQLRTQPKSRCMISNACRARMTAEVSWSAPPPPPPPEREINDSDCEGITKLLKALSIADAGGSKWDVSESEFPDIGWISELVE